MLDSVRRAAVDPGRAFVCHAPRSHAAALLSAPQEKPRDPIDMRGRLDSKGVRYGKVIDFKCAQRRVPRLSRLRRAPVSRLALSHRAAFGPATG